MGLRSGLLLKGKTTYHFCNSCKKEFMSGDVLHKAGTPLGSPKSALCPKCKSDNIKISYRTERYSYYS